MTMKLAPVAIHRTQSVSGPTDALIRPVHLSIDGQVIYIILYEYNYFLK